MRFNKILVAVTALVAASTSFAGSASLVSASPAIGAITTLGVRAPQEYIIAIDEPAGTFAAFCLDQYLSFFGNSVPNPDSYTLGSVTATQATALARLFSGAGWTSWAPAADDATIGDAQRAGLGLAVWDIMTDGTVDFGAGAFQVLSAGGVDTAFATAAFAAGAALPDRTGDLRILDLNDPALQNMVVMVPEPSTYAMLLAGLAGVGFVARRRQQRG